jgi:hypothetical protein
MTSFLFYHLVAVFSVLFLGYCLGRWHIRRVYEARLEEEYNKGLRDGDPEWQARKNGI